MRLTSFTDYALRVLMYLALEPERQATIPEIAAAYGISENHLMKVVQHLSRSGAVNSVRGKGGGISLARPADRIRLGEIVRGCEGDAPIIECLAPDRPSCLIMPGCRLPGILTRAFDALYESLDAYTLADLVARRPGMRKALSSIPDGADVSQERNSTRSTRSSR